MSGGRILLTGATGFVGAEVLARLTDGREVHAVSRVARTGPGGVVWHRADMTDGAACEALVREVRPDTLIHCAWETEHGVFWEADSNEAWRAAGARLFSVFAETGGRRIVATGTCAEYGPSDLPLSESDDTARPATAYGRAKLGLLRHLETLDVSWAWVRVFNAFGAREDGRRFVPSVARALAEGRVAKCSSGRQIRDFIDVRDLGRAVAMLAGHPFEGPVNIGSGAPRPLGDVARLLGEIAGRPDLIGLGQLPDRVGEPPVLVPDITRQAALGFVPAIALEHGLRDAWQAWSRETDMTR